MFCLNVISALQFFGFVVIFRPYGKNIISAYRFRSYGPAQLISPLSHHCWILKSNVLIRVNFFSGGASRSVNKIRVSIW